MGHYRPNTKTDKISHIQLLKNLLETFSQHLVMGLHQK